jgi:hypothetical protein
MPTSARILPFLLLTGCPESPENLPDGSPVPVTDGAPGFAPTSPDSPGGSIPDPSTTQFEVTEKSVTLSGEIRYNGNKEGVVLLQVLTMQANQPPQLLHHEELEGTGAFTLSAPANLGPVRLIFFLDVDGDGPSPTDPAVMQKVEVKSTDQTDLVLLLLDEPNLDDMTPGEDHSDQAAPAPATPTPEAPSDSEDPPDKAPTE